MAALLEVEHLRIEIPSRRGRPVAVDDVSLAIERGEVLGVIAETADRVAVMYAGRIVEIGPVRDVVKAAKQPYTRGLMGSIPLIGGKAARLRQIDGSMPRLDSIPGGCAFNPRCPEAFDRCRRERPDLMTADGAALAVCWLHATKAAAGAGPPDGLAARADG